MTKLSKREMDAYRQAKISNRIMAMDIDKIKAIKHALADQTSHTAVTLGRQIDAMTHILDDSEDALSEIGCAIAEAILQLPSVRQQFVAELYYLDQIAPKHIAAEIGTTVESVHGTLTHAVGRIATD